MAHRRLVAIGWIAVAVGVFAISSSVGTRKSNNFSLPNTGSQRATDLLTTRFPAQAGDSDQIVFHARAGKLGDPAIRSSGQRDDRSRLEAAARDRRREPLRDRVEGDLVRRHDRLRDGDVRPAGESAAQGRDPARDRHARRRRARPRCRSSSVARRSSRRNRPASASRRSSGSSRRW